MQCVWRLLLARRVIPPGAFTPGIFNLLRGVAGTRPSSRSAHGNHYLKCFNKYKNYTYFLKFIVLV